MLDTANTPLPRIAVLGQVPYTTIVSGAGSGVSRHGDIAVNRWRNDSTRDAYGQWCYLRDVRTGRIWSAGHQPVCADSSWYRVALANDRVTFHRRDGSFETLTEIVVVPGAPAEARRVVVSNLSDAETEIELTSYQEIVLAPPVSDRGHRAFGNLFVQTEWLPGSGSILAMRRPRSAKDKPAWCGHTIAAGSVGSSSISCETDRARFIGRGRSSRNPVAMDNPGELSGTVGAVLDPVVALRTRLLIPAGESARVIFTTFVAEKRDEAVRLAGFYHVMGDAERAFDLSAAEGERELGELGITAVAAAAYQDMAGVLLYGSPPAGALAAGRGDDEPGRAELLAMGITGEWPILLATVQTLDGVARVTELLTLHRYWRCKGIACDLVILCGVAQSDQQLKDEVVSIVIASGESDLLDQPRGVFVRRSDALRPKDVELLGSSARIRVDCSGPTMIEIADG
ncbi:MAG: hypothetical protein Q7S20_08550 [Gemmatimonadaceae bacterium]|nr:hypothetical protein [Gemmatimonadaceae bacterium]